MNSYLLTHRELIKHLTLREIKSRYKQSFLGLFWVILNPFLQMLIMSFIFSKILRFNNVGIPYPLFVYSGLLPWFLFANTTTHAINVLVENSALIKKIYFPREILIIAELSAKTFDFLLASVVFVLMMVYYQMPFSIYYLFIIPVLILQLIFTYSVSLLIASLNLFYRDIQYVFNLMLTMWFYITPVLYSVDFFPAKYRWIFQINPMSVYINAYRQILFNHAPPNLVSLVSVTVLTLVIYIFAIKIFKRLEGIFADVI